MPVPTPGPTPQRGRASGRERGGDQALHPGQDFLFDRGPTVPGSADAELPGWDVLSDNPFSLPLPEVETEDGLLPLKAVRELAMQELEAVYLRRLVERSGGNFQRALTISGLSRARLYDLLNKHSMSISGS